MNSSIIGSVTATVETLSTNQLLQIQKFKNRYMHQIFGLISTQKAKQKKAIPKDKQTPVLPITFIQLINRSINNSLSHRLIDRLNYSSMSQLLLLQQIEEDTSQRERT